MCLRSVAQKRSHAAVSRSGERPDLVTEIGSVREQGWQASFPHLGYRSLGYRSCVSPAQGARAFFLGAKFGEHGLDVGEPLGLDEIRKGGGLALSHCEGR